MDKNRFRDALNTAVFTTKFVLEGNTITYVSHDEDDGAWQFFSDDEFDDFEQVAKLVSLEEMIEIDPTIIELSEMGLGYYATRIDKRDNWVIKKQK